MISQITKSKSGRLTRVSSVAVVVVLVLIANVAGRFAADFWNRKAKSVEAQTQPSPQILAGLKVQAEQLQLGDVWEAPQHVVQFRLENITQESLTVENFGVGCECIKVVPESFTVPAGQCTLVALHLNLTHRSPHQYGVACRELSIDLVPNVEGRPTPSGLWKVHGTICSRVGLVDRHLQFADVAIHGGSPISKSVQCLIHEIGGSIEAKLPPEFGRVAISKPTGSPLNSQITVTLNPSLPVGKVHFELPIMVIRASGEREPGPVLEVDGEMRSPFQVTPSHILLGDQAVGQMAEAELSVRIPAHSAFSVKQVTSDRSETILRLIKDEHDESADRVLTYQVSQAVASGKQSAEVTVVLQDAKGEVQKVRAFVSCFGVDESKRRIPGK